METLRFMMVSTHYPPYYIGGDAIFVKHLSEELARMGHEVHVFHNPSIYNLLRGQSGGRNDSCTRDQHVASHPYKSARPRLEAGRVLAFGSSRKAERELLRLCRDNKIDVIHWNNTRGFISRPIETLDMVSLYTAHDYYLVCPRSNLLLPGLNVCDKPTLCSVCALRWGKPPHFWRLNGRRVVSLPGRTIATAPSCFAADRLKRDGIQVDRVVRNFVPDPGRCENRSERNTLLYLGLMEPHKDPLTLVQAFRMTQGQHQYKLSMVGEGSQRTAVEAKVKTMGLANRVSIHGFLAQAQLEDLWSRVGYLVIPSIWYENAPLVVLEALARGVPVISSDAGGLPEISVPESGSLVFRAGDPHSLAQKLVEAWNGRDDQRNLIAKARKVYLERHTPRVGAEGYLSLISNEARGHECGDNISH